jgi:hypothetical protein
MSKEAMKLALEAHHKNERHNSVAETNYWCNQYKLLAHQAIEALVKQEQGEPVAWCRYEDGMWVYYETKAWDDLQPLYTTPQQRKPLTEFEKAELINKHTIWSVTAGRWVLKDFDLIDAIEAAHGIKE